MARYQPGALSTRAPTAQTESGVISGFRVAGSLTPLRGLYGIIRSSIAALKTAVSVLWVTPSVVGFRTSERSLTHACRSEVRMDAIGRSPNAGRMCRRSDRSARSAAEPGCLRETVDQDGTRRR